MNDVQREYTASKRQDSDVGATNFRIKSVEWELTFSYISTDVSAYEDKMAIDTY